MIEGHLKTIYTKYGSNLSSGFGEEDFLKFSYSTYRENQPRPLAAMFFEKSS
jgi:hypothetical protein